MIISRELVWCQRIFRKKKYMSSHSLCVFSSTTVLIKDPFKQKKHKKKTYLLAHDQLIYTIGRRTNLGSETHYIVWNINKVQGQGFLTKQL